MSAGKSKSRWKQAEREVANALGTTRIPNSGFGQPDVVLPASDRHPAFAIQCKTKAALPAWFTDAVNQSVIDAGYVDDDVPAIPAVVVILAPGSGIKKQRFVILRFADAVSLLGDMTADRTGTARSEGE